MCYDAVAHGLCSIALQAFGVPTNAIVLTLLTLQTMRFWLRTAFGDADESFGGTPDDPFYGISQGGGNAPPSYTATSSVAVVAYKTKNYQPRLRSAITLTVWTLAAILYVDDTDQLHLADDEQSAEDFMLKIQDAITFWGMIVLATGGYLKQSKCQVAVNVFRFVNGVATSTPLSRLPKHQFTIPQKNDTTADIPTVDADAYTKSLGVHFDMNNKCDHQVDKIVEKGGEWTSRLNSEAHISPRDAWCSFRFQLRPSLTYSNVALSAKPEDIEEAQRRIFFNSLSRLGVNQHIREVVRRIPNRYGGLGMFDLNIDALGSTLHELRMNWNTSTAAGNELKQNFETFHMDLGLEGNIFTKNYHELGYLAEHGWFKNLWQTCFLHSIELDLHTPDIPMRGREGDKSFLQVCLDSGHFTRATTARIIRRNRISPGTIFGNLTAN